MDRNALCALTALAAVWLSPTLADVTTPPAETSSTATHPGRRDVYAEARRVVEASDRYLHHTHLRRGMTGYGLTVLAGTEIVRFEAEIVSVVENWAPRRDAILARLSGQGLEETGIIAGMSGSPVYMRDPRDGRVKMIGAVAYGWSLQKEPLCGIQPITQMLAVSKAYEVLEGGGGAQDGGPESGSAGPRGGRGRRESLGILLDPRKRDFGEWLAGELGAGGREPAGPAGLEPLATPLMVSGMGDSGWSPLRKRLEPLGLLPVQSGGGGTFAQAGEASLEPGSGISVVLVRGDADWYGVGTVTDVIGDRVLAFGHAMLGEGELDLPVGPAYIHTVVSSISRSFKLGATATVTGATVRDELVALAAERGRTARMIPMTLRVAWPDIGRVQEYQYELCRHPYFSAVLPQLMLSESALALQNLPEEHTVAYEMSVDFGDLGTYQTGSVSSGGGLYYAASDLSRPLAAMAMNPFAPTRYPERIDVSVTVTQGRSAADLLALQLDGQVYRPGAEMTGTLEYRPVYQPRRKMRIRFRLPEDLPEGEYKLYASGLVGDRNLLRQTAPHRFDPDSQAELFETLQMVVGRADRVYLRLPLQEGGLAVGQTELPNLPPGRAAMLQQASLPDTMPFRASVLESVPSEHVVQGAVSTPFRVTRKVGQVLLRKP